MNRNDDIIIGADFSEVKQDEPGIVATTGGGLHTRNLINCICLIFSNGRGTYGMLHISPGHMNTVPWVTSMINAVGATTVIVTGANYEQQTQARLNELAGLLAGLVVTDETRSGWVPAALNPIRGSNTAAAGYVAVNASNGDYGLRAIDFVESETSTSARTRAKRNSSDGCCVIQ